MTKVKAVKKNYRVNIRQTGAEGRLLERIGARDIASKDVFRHAYSAKQARYLVGKAYPYCEIVKVTIEDRKQ